MQTLQRNFKIKKWLYPVSFLYGLGVRIRNKCFDWGILKQKEYPIPIICVGNITVGGTGKTPHTEFLISLLKDQYNVAVLSRGYKRKTKGYRLAVDKFDAETIGDEPYQIKSKYPEVTVAVDENRCRGIENLLKLNSPKIDVILLDDAYQHRHVKAGLNILLIDMNRPICEDKLLPAGLLREPASGKHRANIVVVTKCSDEIKPIDFNITTKQLALYPFQKLYFSNFKYGELYLVFKDAELEKEPKISLSSLHTFNQVLLLSGIANPIPLINKIKEYNTALESLHYKDHHDFTKEDIKEIEKRFEKLTGDNKIIITTEKDATRLVGNRYLKEDIKKYIYCLPIEVNILQQMEESFIQNILDYVRENKRDS